MSRFGLFLMVLLSLSAIFVGWMGNSFPALLNVFFGSFMLVFLLRLFFSKDK